MLLVYTLDITFAALKTPAKHHFFRTFRSQVSTIPSLPKDLMIISRYFA